MSERRTAALGLVVVALATSMPLRVAFSSALGCVAAGLWIFTGALRRSTQPTRSASRITAD